MIPALSGTPPAGVRVLIATRPVDFRRGADGLAATVQSVLRQDPFSGTIFVFRSKRADRVKMLVYDGTGLVLIWKRLEGAKFGGHNQAFVNAFGPSGSAAGIFMLEYNVTALTRLPPATVTVDFNSQTAYDYQRTTQVSRDTWGHVTSETVSIAEHLQQSKAGTVTVDPGGTPLSPDTQKLLVTWGNDTLQRDVEQAIAAATQMMDSNTAPTFSITAVSSFHNVFVQGQVVPWVITPRASIPAFSAADWEKVSSSVSIRPMKVAFTVQDLDRNGVASIELVVTYPVGASVPASNNTYQFTPASPSSWIFEAPGQSSGGVFDGAYTYHYVVHYSDGSAPFTSAEIKNDQSEVHITANDLNVLLLEFSADNVPFKATGATRSDLFVAGALGANLSVDYVLIDLFFVNQSTGQPIQLQQARLDATNKSHVFKSETHEPFGNPCSYRVTYVLTSAQNVVIDWQTTTLAAPAQTGTSTAPVLHLNSPFQGRTISLFPLAPAGQGKQMVAINATYTDSVNNVNEQNSWSITDFSKPPKIWSFLAPANKNVQVVSFDGTYVMAGVPYELQPTKTSQPMLVLNRRNRCFLSQSIRRRSNGWPAILPKSSLRFIPKIRRGIRSTSTP